MHIVLIDGIQFVGTMTRYDIGCGDGGKLHLKKFDEDFFELGTLRTHADTALVDTRTRH